MLISGNSDIHMADRMGKGLLDPFTLLSPLGGSNA